MALTAVFGARAITPALTRATATAAGPTGTRQQPLRSHHHQRRLWSSTPPPYGEGEHYPQGGSQTPYRHGMPPPPQQQQQQQYQQPPAHMPSLHLPVYFELREVGKNFRYKTDPSWVIDVIHRDCVREEGLSYIAEASTYSVTFFQLINYCAKRGYEVVSYGVTEDSQTRGSRRWAVLRSRELHAAVQAAAPPPHLQEAAQSALRTPEELEAGLQEGRYVKWGDRLVPTERKMDRQDMLFYDQNAEGKVAQFAPADVEVIHQGESEQGEPQQRQQKQSIAEFAGELRKQTDAETSHVLRDAFSKDKLETSRREVPNISGRYMQPDLSLKMPSEERNTRGI